MGEYESEWMHDSMLLGGFRCRLTTAEQNAWQEYARQQDVTAQYLGVKSRIEALKLRRLRTSGDEDEYVALREKQEELLNRAFDLAQDWFNDGILPARAEKEG